ncbi:LAFE_0E08306g1_1 [Lachancea fermentati]|uniref:LAFE_0E08306g1_1 n=1 Tax=Lachancea fermentati TaxID=4955 RepID=A0A1G4MDI4_LACFM|nr:LAFE_0E08306g1_1 [Lachancea fermentati]
MAYKHREASPNGGLKTSIRQMFLKCRAGLQKISREALDTDSDSETCPIDSLFETNAKDSKIFDRNSEDRNSSTSVALTKEMRLTDEDDDLDGLNSSSTNNEAPVEKETFSNFDPVQECNKLRMEIGEPFTAGEQIWKRRRELWTTETSPTAKEASKKHRKRFSEISPQHYIRIYRKLVLEDAPLKEPVNLQDAMKVINAGWVETQKWERAAQGLA